MVTLYAYLGIIGLTGLIYLIIKLLYNVEDTKGSMVTLILVLIMIVEMTVLYPMFDMVFDPDGVFQLTHSKFGYMLCTSLVVMFELTWLAMFHSCVKLTRKV